MFCIARKNVKEIQRKTGTLGNELRNALLLSIGLESAAAFADGFKNLFGNEGGNNEGGEGTEGTEAQESAQAAAESQEWRRRRWRQGGREEKDRAWRQGGQG